LKSFKKSLKIKDGTKINVFGYVGSFITLVVVIAQVASIPRFFFSLQGCCTWVVCNVLLTSLIFRPLHLPSTNIEIKCNEYIYKL